MGARIGIYTTSWNRYCCYTDGLYVPLSPSFTHSIRFSPLLGEGFSIDSVAIVYVFGYSRLALSLELFHPKLDRSLGNPTTFAQVLRVLSRTE